jgi:hypothetical protein
MWNHDNGASIKFFDPMSYVDLLNLDITSTKKKLCKYREKMTKENKKHRRQSPHEI